MGIMNWLFGLTKTKNPVSQKPKSTKSATITIPMDGERECMKKNDPKVLKFSANLSPETPILALINHGKTAVTGEAEKLWFSKHGYWLPKKQTWRELGISIDEMEDPFAEDYRKYLPLLTSFRKYVESGGPLENRIRHAVGWCSTPQGKKLVKKFGDKYQPFPEAFFLGPLDRVKGLGPSKIKELKTANIVTQQDLREIDDDTLLAIPGFGPKRVKTIRKHLAEHAWSIPGTGEVAE